MTIRGPHSHILLMGGGGVRGIFLGSEILAKRDFLGSMKDVGIVMGHKKNTRSFWVSTFHQFKSPITQAQFTVGVGFFWVDKILKLGFFGV